MFYYNYFFICLSKNPESHSVRILLINLLIKLFVYSVKKKRFLWNDRCVTWTNKHFYSRQKLMIDKTDSILKKIFGYDNYRPLQKEIIDPFSFFESTAPFFPANNLQEERAGLLGERIVQENRAAPVFVFIICIGRGYFLGQFNHAPRTAIH